EVLLWSGDDQEGAFFMYRIPEPWLGYMTVCTLVPGHVLGMNAMEIWLAMTMPPMCWVCSVPIFQGIHRRGPRDWWSTCVDEFDAGEALDCQAALPLIGSPGNLRARMRESYRRSAIRISETKANQRQVLVTRMGVEVDGVAGRAANDREKNVQLYSLTSWLLT
ncbi:unnamed protein product, partial [Prorocentrum cordatum]